MAQRSFSGMKAKDALQLVPVRDVTAWDLSAAPYPPSDVLLANLQRAKSFALTASEAAKVTLIDTLLLEIVPTYPTLKVWKEEPIESGAVGGIADYLIAPSRGYMEIHGIVSNGQGWIFYRLTRTPEVWVSGLFTFIHYERFAQTIGGAELCVRRLRCQYPTRGLTLEHAEVADACFPAGFEA